MSQCRFALLFKSKTWTSLKGKNKRRWWLTGFESCCDPTSSEQTTVYSVITNPPDLIRHVVKNKAVMEKGLFSFFPLVSVVCVNVITRRQIATIVWSLSVLVLLWLSRRLKGFLLTGLAFFAPTLALWTISFLSPSCMPLSPATA